MKKTVTKRIKFRKNGKLSRRKMGIGHNGTRDSKSQKTSQKKAARVSNADKKAVEKIMSRFN